MAVNVSWTVVMATEHSGGVVVCAVFGLQVSSTVELTQSEHLASDLEVINAWSSILGNLSCLYASSLCVQLL